MIELVAFAKAGGPLTKTITLVDGELKSDGSACKMSLGVARRVRFADLAEFAAFIGELAPHQAIGLGALRGDLPDSMDVLPDRLLEPDGGGISRTLQFIRYRSGVPALALIDIDCKGMPVEVRRRVRALGGFWAALVTVMPALATAARVVRASTSTGISVAATGAPLVGSNGHHVYLLVRDGGDVDRFLPALHERCWISGLGWHFVGGAGQVLERSLIDKSVRSPERLVFEGAPILDPALHQDLAARQATAIAGVALDTTVDCPLLSAAEIATAARLKGEEEVRLAPEIGVVRERASIAIVARTGCTIEAARHVVARQCEARVLLPPVVLPFDTPALAGSTVADVLADPDKFVGQTLSDPLEGEAYDRGKAMVLRRGDGSTWINSFAHGGIKYELKETGEPEDNRRRDTARSAFRMLQNGVRGADILVTLDAQNGARANPLPPRIIRLTALWAARKLREGANG